MGKQREFQGHAKELVGAGGDIQVHWKQGASLNLETLTNRSKQIFTLHTSLGAGLDKRNDVVRQTEEIKGH